MSGAQKGRAGWCAVHLAVAGVVQWNAHGSLAVTALSHLVFFGAIGDVAGVGVEVGGNFEVWRRCTVRLPFGYVNARYVLPPNVVQKRKMKCVD